MKDLDPTHQEISQTWREKIAALIAGHSVKDLEPKEDKEN